MSYKLSEKEIFVVGQELKHMKGIMENNFIGIDYTVICILALDIIEQVLGEQYEFPIDIEEIVKNIGVEVIYQPLNRVRSGEEKHVHKVVGSFFTRPNLVTGVPITCIMIDSEAGVAEQRYALAHELVHCLIHKSEKMFSSSYRVMPMLFKDMEEVVADAFAIFMLIPLPIFLKTFYEYIRSQSEPVRTSEWLHYLNIIANVPYEDVAIGYQNIRYVFGILYKIKHDEKAMENFCKRIREVTSDETRDEVIEIAKKQIQKTLSVMNEEVENVLFW